MWLLRAKHFWNWTKILLIKLLIWRWWESSQNMDEQPEKFFNNKNYEIQQQILIKADMSFSTLDICLKLKMERLNSSIPKTI
jgi:hypothetical protein